MLQDFAHKQIKLLLRTAVKPKDTDGIQTTNKVGTFSGSNMESGIVEGGSWTDFINIMKATSIRNLALDMVDKNTLLVARRPRAAEANNSGNANKTSCAVAR